MPVKQKHESNPQPLLCWYLSAGVVLRLSWCICLRCLLVASPYPKWLNQSLLFNTSKFLRAHWCWKKVCSTSLASWWTQQHHWAGIRVQTVGGLAHPRFRCLLLVEGMPSCVPAQPGSVPALSLPSTLHFNKQKRVSSQRVTFPPWLTSVYIWKHLFCLSSSHLNNSPG